MLMACLVRGRIGDEYAKRLVRWVWRHAIFTGRLTFRKTGNTEPETRSLSPVLVTRFSSPV
jgi:hypothetical protein